MILPKGRSKDGNRRKVTTRGEQGAEEKLGEEVTEERRQTLHWSGEFYSAKGSGQKRRVGKREDERETHSLTANP